MLNRSQAAHRLLQTLRAEGHAVTTTEAFALAHVAERVAQKLAEEQDEQHQQARFQRQRRADVAGWVAEQRSFGLWDGE